MLKFSFIVFFMFSFFFAPKDVLKTGSVDKRCNVYMLEYMVQGCSGAGTRGNGVPTLFHVLF